MVQPLEMTNRHDLNAVHVTIPGFELVTDGKEEYIVRLWTARSMLVEAHMLISPQSRYLPPLCDGVPQEYVIKIGIGEHGWLVTRRYSEFDKFNDSVHRRKGWGRELDDHSLNQPRVFGF